MKVLISGRTLRFRGKITENWPQLNMCAFGGNRTSVVWSESQIITKTEHISALDHFIPHFSGIVAK